MSSVGNWCEMMSRFLDELQTTLPNEKSINKYKIKFDVVRKTNPKKAVKTFMSSVGAYSQSIMSKDESVIIGGEKNELKEFLDEMNISEHWTNGDLTPASKDAIWQYIQTLFILGNTILMLPADTLNMIEDVAQKCVGQMGEGQGGEIDQTALMQGMQNIFSSMTNNSIEKK